MVSMALSTPICPLLACRRTTAVSGRARFVIAEPKLEILCPTHSLRKAVSDQSVLDVCESAKFHLFLARDGKDRLVSPASSVCDIYVQPEKQFGFVSLLRAASPHIFPKRAEATQVSGHIDDYTGPRVWKVFASAATT
jgi:hypothetical protein